MSLGALVHALQHVKVLKAHQLIFVRLADHATDSGLSWPSHSLLARETGYTREYVIRVMHDLLQQGAMKEVFDAKGRRRYQLPVYDFKRKECSCSTTEFRSDLPAPAPLEAERISRPGCCYVYFIRVGNTPYVKIGVAENPTARLEALQAGHPDELTLEAVVRCEAVEAAYKLESTLHYRYQRRNVRREWYELSPDDVKALASNELTIHVKHPSGHVEPIEHTVLWITQTDDAEGVNSVHTPCELRANHCELSSARVNSISSKSNPGNENHAEPLKDEPLQEEPEQTGARTREAEDEDWRRRYDALYGKPTPPQGEESATPNRWRPRGPHPEWRPELAKPLDQEPRRVRTSLTLAGKEADRVVAADVRPFTLRLTRPAHAPTLGPDLCRRTRP